MKKFDRNNYVSVYPQHELMDICEPTVGGDLPLPCWWRAPNHRGGWQACPLRPSWRLDARRQDSHGPGHLSRTHSSPALLPSPPACAALTEISLPDVLSSPALRSLFPAWCTTWTFCNNQMAIRFLLFSSLLFVPFYSLQITSYEILQPPPHIYTILDELLRNAANRSNAAPMSDLSIQLQLGLSTPLYDQKDSP